MAGCAGRCGEGSLRRLRAAPPPLRRRRQGRVLRTPPPLRGTGELPTTIPIYNT
nr:MAG TPA: hypothetical protein [Bacteriophage sp.]